MTDAAALVVRDLRELIAALDRRIPRQERPTEADIARSAEALRDIAVRHIAELTVAVPGGTSIAPGEAASEARWQAWLAKDREHDRRTLEKVKSVALALFIAASLVAAGVLVLG